MRFRGFDVANGFLWPTEWVPRAGLTPDLRELGRERRKPTKRVATAAAPAPPMGSRKSPRLAGSTPVEGLGTGGMGSHRKRQAAREDDMPSPRRTRARTRSESVLGSEGAAGDGEVSGRSHSRPSGPIGSRGVSATSQARRTGAR